MATGNVQYIHKRVSSNGVINCRGGATYAMVEVGNGVMVAWAKCHPADNFNKQQGRTKASGRLNSESHRFFYQNTTLDQVKEMIYNQL